MLPLDLQLQYVGALCQRAIAWGWQSGRISFPVQSQFPFQAEVSAILNPTPALPSEEHQRADARVQSLRAQREASRRQWQEGPHAPPPPEDVDPAAHWRYLQELSARFQLSELALDVLLIIAAPTMWGELARLYGIVANDPERPICDELLVCQLLGVHVTERWHIAEELAPESPLVRHGLVNIGAGVRPFAELTVDPLISRLLMGSAIGDASPDERVELRRATLGPDEILMPAALLQQILRSVDNHPRSRPLRLVLRGRQGSGRRTVMAMLAERLGYRLGVTNVSLLWHDKAHAESRLRLLLRRIALRGWLPCLDGESPGLASDGDVRESTREVLRRYPGPLFVRCGLDAQPFMEPGYLMFDLPPLSESERAEFFRRTLLAHGLPTSPAETLATKFRIGPGVIQKVVADVATTDPAGSPGVGTARGASGLLGRLDGALRQHRNSLIGNVATQVTRLPRWDQLVLPPDIVDSIQEFVARVRHRRTVYEQWGMDRVVTSARGLTALFQGGPGTGKSMVAGLIARDLDYDLYRIDLSRILSRWIGETEQNLARVFDAAEDGQAVLLFDEADSLFTRRTEVRTSVDRYANVQVNYLLQRLDSFEGIAILTTNQGSGIDAAFKRRLSMRLTFPFPDEEMRRDLWRVHLSPQLPISEPLDLERLAANYELSGGYIRNAVLRAAFLAAQGGSAVTQAHLECAVRLEYQEAGKLFEGGVLE